MDYIPFFSKILSYHTEVEKRNNRISNNLESYK